jgi:Tfp pilus assembly protein PilP
MKHRNSRALPSLLQCRRLFGFLFRFSFRLPFPLPAAGPISMWLILLCLPACAPVVDMDMPDLKNWQAVADKHQRDLPASGSAVRTVAQTSSKSSQPPDESGHSTDAGRASNDLIAATRDPFAPSIPKIAAALPSHASDATETATPASLRLLGTVHDGGAAYALIEADRQVYCVGLKAPLPSYPITVAGIADRTVQLDRLLPDGSRRRTTLRQGQ